MSGKDRDAVLVCACPDSAVINAAKLDELRARLRENGVKYTEIPDLCSMAAGKHAALLQLMAVPRLAIVACHPRAVRWMLHAAGAMQNAGRIDWYDLRSTGAGEIADSLAESAATTGFAASDTAAANDSEWIAWYPVIDYDRCTNCGQCLEFCVFGVYELNAQARVEVVKPENCKNKCPACARICPQVAIMFPRLREAPINGDEVDEAGLAQANVRLKLAQLSGENIHAALAARKLRARRRLLRPEVDAGTRDAGAGAAAECGCDANAGPGRKPACGCGCMSGKKARGEPAGGRAAEHTGNDAV